MVDLDVILTLCMPIHLSYHYIACHFLPYATQYAQYFAIILQFDCIGLKIELSKSDM